MTGVETSTIVTMPQSMYTIEIVPIGSPVGTYAELLLSRMSHEVKALYYEHTTHEQGLILRGRCRTGVAKRDQHGCAEHVADLAFELDNHDAAVIKLLDLVRRGQVEANDLTKDGVLRLWVEFICGPKLVETFDQLLAHA